MKPRIESEAERMRSRAELSPGSGGWQRRQRSVAQKEKRRIQQKANRLYTRSSKPIHPLIAAVRAEELIAAGWGSFERWNIPLDWRTRQPGQKIRHATGQKLTSEARNGQNGTHTSGKLA